MLLKTRLFVARSFESSILNSDCSARAELWSHAAAILRNTNRIQFSRIPVSHIHKSLQIITKQMQVKAVPLFLKHISHNRQLKFSIYANTKDIVTGSESFIHYISSEIPIRIWSQMKIGKFPPQKLTLRMTKQWIHSQLCII